MNRCPTCKGTWTGKLQIGDYVKSTRTGEAGKVHRIQPMPGELPDLVFVETGKPTAENSKGFVHDAQSLVKIMEQ